MTREYLVVALTENGRTFEKPEIYTLDELQEAHKKAWAATDGNWSWVILHRINVEISDVS